MEQQDGVLVHRLGNGTSICDEKFKEYGKLETKKTITDMKITKDEISLIEDMVDFPQAFKLTEKSVDVVTGLYEKMLQEYDVEE